MKVCIIPAATYPIPAVKGGAVEGLIEYLVEENEIFGELDITVISVYDEKAQERGCKYKNTTIHYEKKNKWIDHIQEKKLFIYINKIAMKFLGMPCLTKDYVKRSVKGIDFKAFDVVVVEGGGDIYNYRYLVKHVDKEKLWVHMHADLPGDIAYKKMFSKYICVSDYVARILTMNGIINRNDVFVLPNCVDLKLFSNEDEKIIKEYRKKYNLENEDFVFIYWGRLMAEKGVLELVKAFKRFNKIYGNTKLLIVGNPQFGYQVETDYTKALKLELNDEKCKNSITFTGFIRHEDLWKVIKSANVAVIPSVWNDCAPLVVFEAFASKIPTITTRVGGVGEIANEGNSVLIDWKIDFENQLFDAMEKLYIDRELRVTIKNNAYRDIKDYSIENYYKNFVKIVKSCNGDVYR